jgi:hypothetical protein
LDSDDSVSKRNKLPTISFSPSLYLSIYLLVSSICKTSAYLSFSLPSFRCLWNSETPTPLYPLSLLWDVINLEFC